MNSLKSISLLLLLIGSVPMIQAQTRGDSQTVMVGGEEMYPTQDIVSNAVNSEAHTTLVAAVKAAGLVETLKGEGPFTVFAPTNDAFENLPEGTVETLLEPENKATLSTVLTYHVVAGNMTMKKLKKAVADSDSGQATLTTVSGDKLFVSMNGANNIILTDENGNTANISTYDVVQSNGVIHVIDAVVLPE